ncbi:MAG: hypothetical protein CL840_05325 [Crocinitomicaceae bacterium]|nr:hypothetical protein [Crocinitomicaceae bacterium]|tara:strand:- start:6159 stop:7616 length:1458 start_codon:yes stop_codon:yes gene_type:complete
MRLSATTILLALVSTHLFGQEVLSEHSIYEPPFLHENEKVMSTNDVIRGLNGNVYVPYKVAIDKKSRKTSIRCISPEHEELWSIDFPNKALINVEEIVALHDASKGIVSFFVWSERAYRNQTGVLKGYQVKLSTGELIKEKVFMEKQQTLGFEMNVSKGEKFLWLDRPTKIVGLSDDGDYRLVINSDLEVVTDVELEAPDDYKIRNTKILDDGKLICIYGGKKNLKLQVFEDNEKLGEIDAGSQLANKDYKDVDYMIANDNSFNLVAEVGTKGNVFTSFDIYNFDFETEKFRRIESIEYSTEVIAELYAKIPPSTLAGEIKMPKAPKKFKIFSPIDLFIDKNGNFYLIYQRSYTTGSTETNDLKRFGEEILVVKFDADGSQQWTTVIPRAYKSKKSRHRTSGYLNETKGKIEILNTDMGELPLDTYYRSIDMESGVVSAVQKLPFRNKLVGSFYTFWNDEYVFFETARYVDKKKVKYKFVTIEFE